MEILLSVNRNWIYDSYFSLYRPIHPGEMSGREMSEGELSEYHLECRPHTWITGLLKIFGCPVEISEISVANYVNS